MSSPLSKLMKLTFISNYMNHHQQPLCDELYRALGDDFTFIQRMEVDEGRIALGWAAEHELPYLRLFYEDEAGSRALLDESDIVMLGWIGDDAAWLEDEILRGSLDRGRRRPVLRVSERIYKTGRWKAISPRGLVAKYHQHIRYRRAPVYLLCAGGYVASDYIMIGAYPDKMFRWGYFPEIRELSREELEPLLYPGGGRIELIWAGRMIPWKHPEYAIRLARSLKSEGRDFRLTMVGDAADSDLAGYVTFTGALPPAEVRKYMDMAHIGLFTSNYLEGWGAVVNEMQGSALAVAASWEAGSVPELIRNGENGYIYKKGDYERFEQAARALMDLTPGTLRSFEKRAYENVRNTWNARVAARELLRVCGELVEGRKPTFAEGYGPMSEPDLPLPAGLFRTLAENGTAEDL